MRLIDANELMEHVYRDKLDSRDLIAQMVKDAPTVDIIPFLREIRDKLTNSLITKNVIDKDRLLIEIRDNVINQVIEMEGHL